MEPDRFDDVAYTVTEEPQELSPRSRLRRRVAGVLTVATITFGGLAAAADALTEGGREAKSSAAPATIRDVDGAKPFKGDRPCRKGHHQWRDSGSSEPRY